MDEQYLDYLSVSKNTWKGVLQIVVYSPLKTEALSREVSRSKRYRQNLCCKHIFQYPGWLDVWKHVQSEYHTPSDCV